MRAMAAPGRVPQFDGAAPPLSFGQERLWFIEKLMPGASLYNEPLVVVGLEGSLHMSAVRAALNHLLARHASLRSHVAERDGSPYVEVRRPGPMPLTVVEMETEREPQRWVAWLDAEAMRPFDLARGPLFRATLIRVPERNDRHVLVLGLHHIVSDGWSVRVLLNEIAVLYAAARRGAPLDEALPPLAVQYGDFAAWQRSQYESGAMAVEEAYWLARLRGARRTVWPRDHVAATSLGNASHLSALVPLVALDRIRRACAAHGGEGAAAAAISRNMVLLAIWFALVQRRTGVSDLTICTAAAGRSEPELEPLIGFFVNVLPLRVDASRNPTFRTLLLRVCEAVLGALAHDRLPFDCLVRSLRPDQEEGRQPLSNVFFAYHNFPQTSIHVEGLSLRRHRHERSGAKYDVCLLAVEHEEEAQMITLQLWYDQNLYAEGSMRATLDEVLHLIAALDHHGTGLRLLALEATAQSDNREDTPW